MRMRESRRGTRQRGSTVVEFALVLTALFSVMFGIMEFSRAAYAYHFVANAAREATRYAMVRGSACTTWASACPAVGSDVSTYVQGIVSTGIYTAASGCTVGTPGCLVVTTTWPGTTGTPASCNTSGANGTKNPGCPVQVQVQYAYGFSLPYLNKATTIAMTSTSQMIISQ